jgi:hypothetical protein
MNDTLRVTSHEHELQLLLAKYPMLSRTELVQIIDHHGPMRETVESALEKLSSMKR